MIEIFDLKRHSHETPEAGTCAMEVVAWLAGEKHSDRPRCACPVIGAYVRTVNDRLSDEDRQKLKPFLPRIAGSRDPLALQRRTEHFAWAAISLLSPVVLDRAGLTEHASALRHFDKSKGLAAAAAAAWESGTAASAAIAKETNMLTEAANAALDARIAAKAAKMAAATAAANALLDLDAEDVAGFAATAADVGDVDGILRVLDEALNLGAQGSHDYDIPARVNAYKRDVLQLV
jgi:hypothetical protein